MNVSLKTLRHTAFSHFAMGFLSRPSASIMASMASSKDKPWTGLAISSNFRIPEMLSYDITERFTVQLLGGLSLCHGLEFETNPNEIKCTETIFRKPNYFVRRNVPRNKKNKSTSHGRKNAHTQKKTL